MSCKFKLATGSYPDSPELRAAVSRSVTIAASAFSELENKLSHKEVEMLRRFVALEAINGPFEDPVVPLQMLIWSRGEGHSDIEIQYFQEAQYGRVCIVAIDPKEGLNRNADEMPGLKEKAQEIFAEFQKQGIAATTRQITQWIAEYLS